MALLLDIGSFVLLLGGVFFAVVGGLGVIRMPDFFTRLHAAGLTDTLGSILVISGLMLQGGWSLISVKLFLILLFLLITSPTASHALARAALVDPEQPAPIIAKESEPSKP